MKTPTTLVMVPCFAGAPWNLMQMHALQDWPMRTFRLPEDLNNLEELSDFVLEQVSDLEDYILLGDSFGAVISIALATRRPRGLQGLVLSGGFAKSPITSPLLRGLAALAPFFSGTFYRELTLRVHAIKLRSVFDREGEIPWSATKTKEFFVKETTHRAYVSRIKAIEKSDYTGVLSRINVPTLILTPEEDRLIGKEAAKIMLKGIAGSTEVLLPRTGHMFRFSHPSAYSERIRDFLQRIFPDGASSTVDTRNLN
jgi:pimeloyl-ACP methyl ester carboxylesterase